MRVVFLFLIFLFPQISLAKQLQVDPSAFTVEVSDEQKCYSLCLPDCRSHCSKSGEEACSELSEQAYIQCINHVEIYCGNNGEGGEFCERDCESFCSKGTNALSVFEGILLLE